MRCGREEDKFHVFLTSALRKVSWMISTRPFSTHHITARFPTQDDILITRLLTSDSMELSADQPTPLSLALQALGKCNELVPFVGRTAWGLLNTPLTAGSSGGGTGMCPPTIQLWTRVLGARLREGTQVVFMRGDVTGGRSEVDKCADK
jgi:hypothetical protein